MIRRAAALDAEGFYADELAARRELGFPPYARMVRVVFRSKERPRAVEASRAFAELAARELPAEAEILGPAECPIAMVAGTCRWQILFRAPTLGALHGAVASILASYRPPASVRIEADVDPVSLM